jgi:hypothetical protein
MRQEVGYWGVIEWSDKMLAVKGFAEYGEF